MEVNLINYLWPLLVVVLSPLILPGYRLQVYHLFGVLLGLVGAFLVIGGGRLSLEPAYLPGYLMAAGDAVIWACYSLLTKRLPPFPNAAVGLFCLVSGLLSLAVFALSGSSFSIMALTAADWGLLFLAGIGPMGLAFFAWDAALKRGDPRIIGSLSYLTPLLSTVNLLLLTGKTLSPTSAAAMALIVGGAAVGSLDLWIKKPVETR